MHVATELYHQGQQLVLLDFAQHAVDVEVEYLQIEVGRHETGEVGIVVGFIHVEELVVVCRHDTEAVFGQLQ